MIDLRQLLTQRNAPIRVRLLRTVLRTLSLPYRLAVGCKNLAYDRRFRASYKSPLLVISVGNLSVGGTGKSPAVAWLAQHLRTASVRIAVLSRGYGSLDNGQNDEALELELRHPDVPHLQHWDRIVSAKLALEELDMQALVLDDGFQHRRIARDLDIVLIDASEAPTARRLLPGGLLREPLSSLRRAHAVVLTRVDQAAPAELETLRQQVRRHAPTACLVHATHAPSSLVQLESPDADVQELQGKKVLAFCGIGNPPSFFTSLEKLGANVLDTKTWPDHYGYQREDLERLSAWAEAYNDADLVICTMKDWVKIQTAKIGQVPLVALAIELKLLDGRAELAALVNRAIEQKCVRDD